MSDELVYKISGDKFTQRESSEEEETVKDMYMRKSVEVKLTKKQKLALDLYIMCGYNQNQIAEFMKITQASVSELIARAAAKLRDESNK